MSQAHSSPSGRPNGWDTELAHAFEILLGRPLGAFDPDATYAFYHWDDVLCAEFYRGLDLSELLRPEIRQSSAIAEPFLRLDDADGTELNWIRYGLDLGRSVFIVDDDLPFAGEVIAALDESATTAGDYRAVFGTTFAAILIEHDVNLSEIEDEYLHLLARVQTDGSLFDAMRAATWTMGGPDRLVPFIDMASYDEYGILDRLSEEDRTMVEPVWEEALRQVGRAALRDHLRRLCLTPFWAASEGGHYVEAQCPTNEFIWLAEQDHRPVAAWMFGQGQGASAVFQLG